MQFYTIINLDLFPRQFFSYVDPDDYFTYQGILQADKTHRPYNSIDELIEHITEYRKANGYEPLPELSLLIQNYLYYSSKAPKSLFTKLQSSQIPKHTRTLANDIKTAMNISIALSRTALTGAKTNKPVGWVNKIQANQRAKTCINCPLNKNLEKSVLIRANNKIAHLFGRNRKTDYDSELYDCGVCGCPLDIKVHYTDEVIAYVTPESVSVEDFPEDFIGKDKRKYTCWMRKILEGENTDG